MHLTVTTVDKQIYLETVDAIWPNRKVHIINDNSFWDSIDKDIWAIQYHDDGEKHIEYKVSTGKGNVPITDISILQIYINKFNEYEVLYQSRLAWDKNNIQDETFEQKVTRIGQRP